MMKKSSINESKMADPNKFSLSELKTYEVGVIQSAAMRAVRKKKDEYLQPYGLTGMQWVIIGTILEAGRKGTRITDMAKMLDVTMAFLTNSVNLLESKGIIERIENVNDSRSRMVRVTEGHIHICEKIEDELRQALRESIYSKLTPLELHTYIRVLYKFAELA